jgi:hypothetical protein
MALRAGILATVLLLAACASEREADAPDTAMATTEAPTTTVAPAPDPEPTPTASGADGPETVDEDAATGACPDGSPVPDEASSLSQAPLAYDGDGDGQVDVLSLYEHADDWWLHVAWASGGSTAVVVEDAGAMGAWPLGGHDLVGDGIDEAWVAMAGPAAGVMVGVYRTVGCELEPVVDDTGMPFVFPVTETVATFTGARCDELGDIDLFTGEMVGPDAAEYLVSQRSYTVADGQATAGPGDAGSISADEVYRYSWLECGDLGQVL